MDITAAIKKMIEDMAWDIERKKRVERLNRLTAKLSPMKRGFAVKSVREDKVIDSSAFVKYLFREANWENISETLSNQQAISIDLLLKESVNAIWKRVRDGTYAEKEASVLVHGLLESAPVRFEAQSDLIPAALEIAIKEGITMYDALFIELARRHNAILVTSNRRQADACAVMRIAAEFVD